MSTAQWLYAVAIASALAVLIQVLGAGLEKLLRTYKPTTWVTRGARFVAFFVFFLYSVARTMSPGLDQRLPPLAFMFGWLVICGLGLHFISRKQDQAEDAASDPTKID